MHINKNIFILGRYAISSCNIFFLNIFQVRFSKLKLKKTENVINVGSSETEILLLFLI